MSQLNKDNYLEPISKMSFGFPPFGGIGASLPRVAGWPA